MIDGEKYLRLRKSIVGRGWLRKEPGDEDIPLEEPRLFANALLTLKRSDPDGISALRQCVGFGPQDLARYAGLRECDLAEAEVLPFQTYSRNDQALNLI